MERRYKRGWRCVWQRGSFYGWYDLFGIYYKYKLIINSWIDNEEDIIKYFKNKGLDIKYKSDYLLMDRILIKKSDKEWHSEWVDC